MSAVDDVYSYLVAQGIAGGSTEWSILRRRDMDSPAEDQLVVLSEDGGSAPEIKASAGIGDTAQHDFGVLVSVRAGAWDGDASKTKALEIITALHGKRSITVGATTYLRVRARSSEPIFAGFDDTGRPRHTVGLLLLQLK